jgi:hypothetical protein
MFGRDWIVAMAFLLASAATASAQPSSGAGSSRWTYGGTVGAGRTWDDEGQIGSGLLAGGYAQWRWLSHTDLEASIDVLTHDRAGGYFEAHGHTVFLSGAVAQRFGGPAGHGYVFGGVTVAGHSGTAGFPADNLLTQTRSTDRGYIFGGGMMFRASRRFEAGPMVRITLLAADSDSDPASAIAAGVRVGFR